MTDTHRTTDPVTDYLDRPPQRWKHEFQKASGSREMVEDRDGEWVKFEDMDLYMFEGGQLMLRLMDSHKDLLAALKRLARAYVSTMESGRDRIVALGGDCDPVDVMERGDPYLRIAKEAIAKAEGRS